VGVPAGAGVRSRSLIIWTPVFSAQSSAMRSAQRVTVRAITRFSSYTPLLAQACASMRRASIGLSGRTRCPVSRALDRHGCQRVSGHTSRISGTPTSTTSSDKGAPSRA
jgi:hypothetical protein